MSEREPQIILRTDERKVLLEFGELFRRPLAPNRQGQPYRFFFRSRCAAILSLLVATSFHHR